MVGGGGYTIENVPRCWANETAISLGINDLPNEIPSNTKSYELYKPDHKLFVPVFLLKINKIKCLISQEIVKIKIRQMKLLEFRRRLINI